MKCATCKDDELVAGKDGMLDSCPDCGPELRRCTVHGQTVMCRNGVLVGKCWGCVNDAANAKQWLREHPYRPKVAA